jgi:guanosine-3',5'-bis(diphosphate) 3'-pyrophosphohydrolase
MAETLDHEIVEFKGLKRGKHKKMELPGADKNEGWFALRATDMFRFYADIPQGNAAGPNARQALAELNFNTPVEISPEGAVPGERVVGILRPGRPMTLYSIESDALTELYESDVAWIDVRWDIRGREDRTHKCAITVLAQNKPGSLAQISKVIAESDANIHNLVMRMASPEFHRFIFEIEVRHTAQLNDVLNSLKLMQGTTDVRRATVAEAMSVANLVWPGTTIERSTEPA